MQKFKTGMRFLIGLVIVILIATTFVKFYSVLFSRKVKGELVKVARVDVNVALMQTNSNQINSGLFSFSVAIREPSGEIVTASAEDRQWAAAKEGFCVEATVYPYPPWELMKGGTYFNARLDKMSDCGGAVPAPTPAQ